MSATAQIKFSHAFPGIIWATLAVPQSEILIIEVRDQINFQVQFSALDLRNKKFLWKGLKLKESWWIGLTAANENTVLLHTYINKGNPDHKNLIALDILTGKIRWEVEEFSFFDWDDSHVAGHITKSELVWAAIDIQTGMVTEKEWQGRQREIKRDQLKPVSYLEGTPYFETVREFMEKRTNYHLIKGVEYLEWSDLIIVSFYIQDNSNLANYLIVFDRNGEVLLEVKLGEKLSGLGTDTFFILSGCLFLIQNKTELVAYTFYD